jgi:hypothetical protein
LEQVQPITVRQTEVKDGGVIGGHRQRRARGLAPADRIHDEPGSRQGCCKQFRDPGFILND